MTKTYFWLKAFTLYFVYQIRRLYIQQCTNNMHTSTWKLIYIHN